MRTLLRIGVPALILLLFGAFSIDVAARHGALGFLPLAAREPWAAQLTIDVFLCAFFAGAWIRRDAQDRRLASLPFLIALPFVGSLAVFAYLIRRGLADVSASGAGVHPNAVASGK